MSSNGGSLFSLKTLGVAALLFSLSLLAYSNTFGAGFHLDDFHQIVKNTNIRNLADLPRFFTDPGMSSSYVGNRVYRPLTFISFAANYALGGGGVFGFHAVNLALHFMDAFLVYIVVGAVLGRRRENGLDAAPLLASLLFALHPVATGSVTYITGRAVLLATFFCLLGFLCHLRFRAASGPGGAVWGAATLVFLALGLLSKEMAVSLLGLVFVYDLLFTAPARPGARGLARTFAYYVPVLCALVIYLMTRRSIQGFATVSDTGYSLPMYLVSEARALLVYARLMFLPVNLNADYAAPYARSVDLYAVLGALLLAALLYAAYRLRARQPAVAFFGLWFLVALLPESTLIPRQETIVEYRLYLPLAGFAGSVAVLLAGSLRGRRPIAWAVVPPLLLLGLLTFQRNTVWATEYSLWSDTAKKSPYSARAYANLGQALLAEKRYDEAAAALGQALRINPYFSQAGRVYNDLGRYLYDAGRYGESAEQFKEAIKLEPSLIEGYENLGAAYYHMGRFADAAGVLEGAVARDPSYPYTRKNLALCYMEMGRGSEALDQMLEAARYAPGDFGVVYTLALVYAARGMKSQAPSEAKSAMSLASDAGQRKEAGSLITRLSGEAG